MRLRLTVRTDQTVTDVSVECEPDDPISLVVDAIRDATGIPDNAGTPVVDGNPVDLTGAVGAACLHDGVLLDFRPHARPNGPAGPAPVVAVSAGPDLGASAPLVPGMRLVVGRHPRAGLPLNPHGDTDVSAEHLAVEWDGHTVWITDLGSTNHTLLGPHGRFESAVRITARRPWSPGDQVQIGGTRLTLTMPATHTRQPRLDGEGGQVVTRAPRVRRPQPADVVVIPSAPPASDDRPPLPWLTLVLPPLLGVGLAVFTGQWSFLLFTLLTPVMAATNWVSGRRPAARRRAQAQDRYDTAIGTAAAHATRAADEELAFLHSEWPDPRTVARVALERDPALWARRPADDDWLRLRLGSRNRKPDTELRGDPPTDHPKWTEALLRAAPEGVSLTQHTAVGIVGDGDTTIGALAAAVLQLAVLHGPDDLRLVLVAPGWSGLDWLRWLPHMRSGTAVTAAWDLVAVPAATGQVLELIARRESQARPGTPVHDVRPDVVVIIAGADELATRREIRELLVRGPAAGIRFVCTAADARLLPGECTAVLTCRGDRATLRDGRMITEVAPDRIDRAAADTAARALAPLRLIGRADGDHTALPTLVRVSDLTGPIDPAAIAHGWAASPSATAVPIGRDTAGPVLVDLATDGPHGVVVGTSGAGKSELLITLLAGLAMRSTPEWLNFLFIDYKGGATFQDLRRLPHVVGNVTNLSGSPARVLDWLDAELQRRQRQLDAHGVSTVDAYLELRATNPALPLFPRLVIVVDEFAELNLRLPHAVENLVSIARTGRALRVHLILATQPPARIDENIKANSDLRICLRVPVEYSQVLLDRPDAGAIPKSLVGRAFARIGDQIREIQTAWAGGRRPGVAGQRQPRAVRLSWSDLGLPSAPSTQRGDESGTELAAIIEAVTAAADAGDLVPRIERFHDDLPTVVDLGTLPVARHELMVGLRDLPSHQRQDRLAVPLGSGHLLLVGGAQTGRTTALRTVAVALAQHTPPDRLRLHAIDTGGGLAVLAGLPHSDVIATATDGWRIDRLLHRLTDLVRTRRAALAARGVSSVADWRAREPVAAPADIVLLVDGATALTDQDERLDRFLALVRDGLAAGVTVCLAARDNELRSRLTNSFEHRLVLRLTDAMAGGAFGLSSRATTADFPPGRGIWVTDGSQVQVPVVGTDAAGQHVAVVAVVDRLRAACREVPAPGDVIQVDALPTSIGLAGLLDGGGAHRVLLGLAGDRLAPVRVDTNQHRVITVIGPRRSGRSTALATLAASALAGGNKVGLVPHPNRPAAAHGVAVAHGVDLIRRESLSAVVADYDIVVIDDADVGTFDDTLTARLGTEHGPVLIAATEPDGLAGFRGMPPRLAAARAGIVLSPVSRMDCLGVRIERTMAFSGPPGRGYFVLDGECTQGQVPLLDS